MCPFLNEHLCFVPLSSCFLSVFSHPIPTPAIKGSKIKEISQTGVLQSFHSLGGSSSLTKSFREILKYPWVKGLSGVHTSTPKEHPKKQRFEGRWWWTYIHFVVTHWNVRVKQNTSNLKHVKSNSTSCPTNPLPRCSRQKSENHFASCMDLTSNPMLPYECLLSPTHGPTVPPPHGRACIIPWASDFNVLPTNHILCGSLF